MLDHERLDVYRCSLELASLALGIAAGLPRGNAPLADQLRRAATGIPLHIAEGSGKFTLADRANFFRIARGSALECAAALDVVALVSGSTRPKVDAGKALVTRIVEMLTKMAKQ